MESPSKDIYHQDVPPPLARRHRRWFQQRAAPAAPPASDPYRGSAPGRDPRFDVSARQEQRARRRRRRSEHAPQTTMANRILWIGISLVVGLYVVLLGASMVRARFRPPPPVVEAPVDPAPATPADATAAPPIAEAMATWKNALRLAREATTAADAGKPEEAQAKLADALAASPDLVRAELELARLLIQKKQYGEAETLLRKVLSADPESQSARMALAGMYAAAGRHEEALLAARWILEADSYSVEGHELAAQSLLNLNQPSDAIAHLRRLVGLNRDDLIAQNNLGVAYMKVKDYRAALVTFRDVLKADAGNSMAYYNMAVCHAQQARAEEAVEVLVQASVKFGATFVLTWTQSSDFDAVRHVGVFADFVDRGARPPETAPSATAEADAAGGSAGEPAAGP